jgi:membrane protein DedA with SNARE-associated domain/rhodanese-related sulfurtransferase
MGELLQFTSLHGPIIIFAIAFANDMGLPIPTEFVLLQVGTLVALGKFNPWWGVAMPMAGTLLADVCLFFIGRRWGTRCLRLAYRFSLEPEEFRHRRERLFGRLGLRFLLISKFLPMSMVPPVLAGMTRINLFRFLIYSAAGTALWVSLYTGVGVLFYRQIDSIVRIAGHATGALAIVGGALPAVYIAFKLVRRRRILRRHHQKRIAPEELKARMDAGSDLVVVDVRSRRAIETFPYVIPGAILIPREEVEERREEIPTGKELVLYCCCSDDAESARVAILLNKKDVERVHPLSGGIEAWHARRYPVEKRVLPPPAVLTAEELSVVGTTACRSSESAPSAG